MPITTARLQEMADQLREATRGEADILEALAEVRDRDREALRAQCDLAISGTRQLGYMLAHEVWCRDREIPLSKDRYGLRYSPKVWRQCADYVRHGAQFGAALARERGDLPLPMKLYVLSVIRAWRLVAELDDEIQHLDAPADAA